VLGRQEKVLVAMQGCWVWVSAVCAVCIVEGQRRQFLQDVIQRIKSSPKHQSISPSWFGERQFDVIGTGRLPLQSHNLGTDREVAEDDIEEKYFDEFYTNSDRRVFDDERHPETYAGEGEYERVNKYEPLAVNAHIPSHSRPLPNLPYLENQPKNSFEPPDHKVTLIRPTMQRQADTGRIYYNGFLPSQQDQEQPTNTQHPLQQQEGFYEDFKRFRRKPDATFNFGWNQNNRRMKRSPFKRIKIKVNNPFYFSNPKRQQTQMVKIDRFESGPTGFWDNTDFDTNFFDQGHFEKQNTLEDFSKQPNPSYDRGDQGRRRQKERYQKEEDYHGIRRQQETQQTVAMEKKQNYSNVRKYELEGKDKNEILGSGNFSIEKGGTFYDADELPYSYRSQENTNNY